MLRPRDEPRARWPRLVRAVEEYVGIRPLAARYVLRAGEGQFLYRQIMAEAFRRRHKQGDRK